MSFICRICNEDVKMKKDVKPLYHDWAYGECMDWTNLENEIPEELNWNHFCEETPMVGDKKVVFVTKPFDEVPGNEFLSFFMPPMVRWNGFDECSKEDIPKCAIIKCRYDDTIEADAYSAYIRVSVLEVTFLHDLYKSYPETIKNGYIENSTDCDCEIYRDENWVIAGWDAQGDLGESVYIYTGPNGKRHVVMLYEWAFDVEVYYLGNIVLDNEESETSGKI